MSYDIYPGRGVAYVIAEFVEAAGRDTAAFSAVPGGDDGYLESVSISSAVIRVSAGGLGAAMRALAYQPGEKVTLVMERVTGILLEVSSPGSDLMETWSPEAGWVSWWECETCGDRIPERRAHWVGPEGEDGPYCYEDAEKARAERGED